MFLPIGLDRPVSGRRIAQVVEEFATERFFRKEERIIDDVTYIVIGATGHPYENFAVTTGLDYDEVDLLPDGEYGILAVIPYQWNDQPCPDLGYDIDDAYRFLLEVREELQRELNA